MKRIEIRHPGEEAIGDRDAQDGVVGETGAWGKQLELGGFRAETLVDRSDDVSGDRTQHRDTS
jgi:hypothetical protein